MAGGKRARGKAAPAGGKGTRVQYAVFLAYRGFEALVSRLSIGFCFSLGRLAGRFMYFLMPGYRALARRNLRIAFSGEKDETEIRGLARDHFTALGGNLFSSIKMGLMPVEQINARLTVEGTEHIRHEIARGRGIVYLIPHLGAWEILAQTSEFAPGIKRHSLYKPLSNPYLDAHVRQRRQSTGTTLLSRDEGFFAPLRALRAGGGLGVLVDQHAGDKGVWCPFFGRLASTSNLAALLALRTGAAMIPLGLETIGRARWRLVIGAPLPMPGEGETAEGGGATAIEAVTAEMNLSIEKLIRHSPTDWFWVHNRWKTPSPAFLLKRTKRGMVLPHSMVAEDLQPFRMLVRSPNWLGDACMAAPAVRALKRGRPDARVVVLAPEKLADFWRIVPEVDSVLVKPNRCSVFAVARRVREAGPFDAAILLPNSPRSALEVWRAGIPRVVGYAGRWRRRLLDQIIPALPSPAPPRHHVEHYLHLAATLGGDIADREIFSPPWARPLGGTGPRTRVGLCPGAEYGPAKRWPLDRFAETAGKVSAAARGQIEWVILGTPKEAALGEELSRALGGDCRNLAGQTSLRDLVGELRTCEALLTNDTGTMHLAAFLGIPTIAIFGSTEPGWTGPIGFQHTVLRHHVACSPCFLRECPLDFRCMKAIAPAEAAEAVLETLGFGARG